MMKRQRALGWEEAHVQAFDRAELWDGEGPKIPVGFHLRTKTAVGHRKPVAMRRSIWG
jgi:hypothetical protein